MTHYLPGPAGKIEALIDDPASLCTTAAPPIKALMLKHFDAPPPTAAVILAHPHPLYGGSMHTKAVFHAAKAFCRLGCAVVRFNFRGVGASDGAFAEGVGEQDDFRAVMEFAADRYPAISIWAAGISFGSWVAMTAGALDERVERLIGIALPSSSFDFSAVRDSTKPKFFIHGERDELCPLSAVRELYARAAEPKDLVVLDAASHLFDGRLDELGQTIEDLLG
jgi:uncharacterized protein